MTSTKVLSLLYCSLYCDTAYTSTPTLWTLQPPLLRLPVFRVFQTSATRSHSISTILTRWIFLLFFQISDVYLKSQKVCCLLHHCSFHSFTIYSRITVHKPVYGTANNTLTQILTRCTSLLTAQFFNAYRSWYSAVAVREKWDCVWFGAKIVIWNQIRIWTLTLPICNSKTTTIRLTTQVKTINTK